MGIFAEGQKEFGSSGNYLQHIKPVAFAGGLAVRYCISNTFSIASGIGVSVSHYKFNDNDERYYDQFPIENVSGKVTQYSLLMPIILQTNIYKQKLFVSTGFEFTKNLIGHSNATYTNITNNTSRQASYTDKGGTVEAQLMGGLGYNFKALKDNVFSVEANLKIHLRGAYSPAVSSNLYSPSLRINWYFIK